MAKLIDADALMDELNNQFRDMDNNVYDSQDDALEDAEVSVRQIIHNMPTIDVEPVERWISVDEKLPEYKESQGANAYWVAWKKRNGEFGMRLALYCDYGYAMEIEGIPTKVTWRDWDFHVVENVTHWMELPEPPKMDGGSNEL